MTVMTNVVLVLKDSEGNIGIVKSLTDNDIIKIANAITDVGQVVDPATHMPIEATTASVGVVQLATAQDITNGTAGKVVDAKELNNFAQTLPAANGITDVSSGDNSNQIVVSKFGGNKTLTIDNVEHADNADEATHASQADTAASANSVAWTNVSGKPSSYTPSSHTHDDRYYTESEIDTKLSGKSDTTHNHNSAYLGITAKAESAKSADSVAWSNVSSRPTKVSQFTNDSGYITSSGTAATISQKVDSSAKTHTNYNTNGTYVPTMNFLSYWNGAYASSGASNLTYCAQGTIIGSNNIGSQSVKYANSAGSVAWGNVSGRPTAVSQFTNDSGYITTNGAAYPRRVGGVTMNFNWSGQGGQPTWLWGGEDGTNMYVYNPANFSVNYANSAGSSSIAVRDSGGSWISGRDNAVVKQTRHTTSDGSSWNPVASVKTKDGNWTIGTVGRNVLQFSYDTDADYNAGNNTSTVVNLNPVGGTILTTASIWIG